MSPGFRLKVRMTGDPIFRRETRADTGPAEAIIRGAARLDRMANVFAAPLRARVDHWRIVIGMGRMPQFVAVLLTLMMASHLLWTRADKQWALALPMILSTIVPGLVVGAIWPRRWYALADESLRPHSRRSFIREQGAAMAAEYASVWGWITLLTCGLGLMLGDWRDTLPKMLLALPLIASGQLLTFGVIVWVMRYRAGWLVIVPMLLSLLIALPLMIAGGMIVDRGSVFLSMAGTVWLLLMASAVTFDAYRRWLVTEFD
jgi:hypothetical protein